MQGLTPFKDEDPTGLLNEGMRYRDLESGMFISRDPLGFVDGPNVYTYVTQNPWTSFDALGLSKYNWWQGGWAREGFENKVQEAASNYTEYKAGNEALTKAGLGDHVSKVGITGFVKEGVKGRWVQWFNQLKTLALRRPTCRRIM